MIIIIYLFSLNNTSLNNSIATNIAKDMTGNFKESQEKLKRRNQELEESYKQLKVLDDSKDNFIDMISHEIRTPLTVINWYANLFLEGKLGKLEQKQLDYVDRMKYSVWSLLHMIKDILDLSRIQSWKIEVNNAEYDILRSLRHKVQDFNVNASEVWTEIHLIWKSLFVYWDVSKVDQVINNLLGNAVKFTKNGTIDVVLSEEGSDFKFIVKDTGIGIKKEDFPKIFDRFWQAAIGMKREQSGTWLGLHITKNLVELMWGTIDFTSTFGKWTTFTVILPKWGA